MPETPAVLLLACLALLALALAVALRANRRLCAESRRRQQLEHELGTRMQHYRSMIEGLSAVAWESDPQTYRFNYVSPQAEALLGYPLADWREMDFWYRIVHPEDRQWAEAFCIAETTAGRDHSLDYRVLSKDGQVFWVRDLVTLGEEGDRKVMRGLMFDISEQHRTEEKLQQAATVFESTAEGVIITDTQQRISAVNRAFSQITGYTEAEALGETPRLIGSGLHETAFFATLWYRLAADGHWQGEILNRRKCGELFPCWLTINAVRNLEQVITHFVAVFADISSLKQAQARLDHQAHHDPLTGLPNRTLFETRLAAALASDHGMACGALLFLDLDRFKHINDSLGHPVGDLLLKGIAQRLRSLARGSDTLARLGGDEFILLLPGIEHAEQAEAFAEQMLSGFSAPFQAGEHEFFIGASIGVALYPDDGQDVATLVKNADAAMYRAKAKGRNRVECYTRDMTAQAHARIELEQELRRALERDELSLRYQPKFCLPDHALVGAEALIRWSHPVLGDIPPERFVALAEENGTILQLGDWVLEQACAQLQRWRGTPFGALAVNLSGRQLRQPGLPERIRELLCTYGLDPRQLQLEITETFIMNRTEEALDVLHQLKALGVQLAIDDFGTGYSSLSYLKRLPLDTLKIDQSFVRGLPDDSNDAAIARAIIALGRDLNLTVVAEGVETPAQRHFLAREGCEQVQGYLLSPPLSAQAFEARFLQPAVTPFLDGTARQPSL